MGLPRKKVELFEALKDEGTKRDEYTTAQKRVSAANSDIKDSPELAMEVTHHALVNFMGRVLGIDIKAYEDQMLRLCDESEFDEQNHRSEGLQYVYKCKAGPREKSVRFIVKSNKIVTCMTDDNGGGHEGEQS